ncbi:hypothetical protein HHI36_012916, partial [Cryptolaemus montrouzieri]
KENHSISEFVVPLQKYISDCGFQITCGCNEQVSYSAIFLRAQFNRGLKDKWIREHSLQSNVTSFDELFNKAVALEASRIGSREISNQQNTSKVPELNKLSCVPRNREYHNNKKSYTHSRKRCSNSRSKSSSRGRINYHDLGIENCCISCGKSDHKANECRIQRKS